MVGERSEYFLSKHQRRASTACLLVHDLEQKNDLFLNALRRGMAFRRSQGSLGIACGPSIINTMVCVRRMKKALLSCPGAGIGTPPAPPVSGEDTGSIWCIKRNIARYLRAVLSVGMKIALGVPKETLRGICELSAAQHRCRSRVMIGNTKAGGQGNANAHISSLERISDGSPPSPCAQGSESDRTIRAWSESWPIGAANTGGDAIRRFEALVALFLWSSRSARSLRGPGSARTRRSGAPRTERCRMPTTSRRGGPKDSGGGSRASQLGTSRRLRAAGRLRRF